jgi:uncharacterized protein (DUF1015 family)
MALLHPFRALRPTPEVAARVASVPYDVVSRDEAAELAAGNPLSFLHVSRAEIELPHSANPYADDIYQVAANNLRALRKKAPLVLEAEPSVYVYRLRTATHSQTGIAGCFSLDEYERGDIKKHERTRRDKETDRTRHIVALRAQTGLTFLTYRAVSDVDGTAARVATREPLIDFERADGVRHSIWRVAPEDARGLIQAFSAIPTLYIADGHHRIASAARARAELRQVARGAAAELADDRGVAEYDTFVAVAFPHDQVQILPYNRVVTQLNGRTPAAFLEALRAVVPAEPGAASPARRGRVSMYLEGTWYELDLEAPSGAGDDRLDVTRLQAHVLEPLLGVADVRTDRRIDFVGGDRGPAELERRVDRGEAAVAFSLAPVRIDDLFAIADADGIMPPKSTWFAPKVCDGLLCHVI